MARKKRKDSMTGIAVGSIMANTIVGSMPNPTGSAAITTTQTQAAAGFSNVGKALPVMGKVKGTSMVLNSLGGLRKAHKKFRMGKKKYAL